MLRGLESWGASGHPCVDHGTQHVQEAPEIMQISGKGQRYVGSRTCRRGDSVGF